MYIDEPICKYLDDLAAKQPMPGGGSAAALSASIGASLLLMVANFTIGNPKYKSVEDKIAGIMPKIERFSAGLRDLIDGDVEAYNKLSRGIKQLKNDPSKLDEAYKEATSPVFEICRITSECLKLAGEIVEYGNVNLITDTAVAAILLEGAFFSAKFNVYINLKHIKDLEYIGKVHEILSPLEEEMPRLKEEILHKCEEVISK